MLSFKGFFWFVSRKNRTNGLTVDCHIWSFHGENAISINSVFNHLLPTNQSGWLSLPGYETSCVCLHVSSLQFHYIGSNALHLSFLKPQPRMISKSRSWWQKKKLPCLISHKMTLTLVRHNLRCILR